MNDIAKALIAAAARVGADTVKTVIERRAGQGAAGLAGRVIDAVAAEAGVGPAELPDLAAAEPARLDDAVARVEANSPELIALWARGLDHQFALAETEAREGFWKGFWRWGWMYLLALFWVWRIVIGPAVNALTPVTIELIEFGVLLTLTGWFMSLYMGGHTIKELGKSAMEAVRGRRDGR